MILVEADFYVSAGFTGDTHGIAPDSVIAATALRLGLVDHDRRGIDPACGSGGIPGALRRLAFTSTAQVVDAADINPDHCNTTCREMDRLRARGLGRGTVSVMDLTRPPLLRRPYDYVYTSLPFGLFMTGEQLDPAYAHGLLELVGGTGMVVVDSADKAMRDGVEVPVADRQIAYFTANGFKLRDRIPYETTRQVPGFDTQFTELVFSPNHSN